VSVKIKLFGKEIELKKKDLEEFAEFHRNHVKDAKCYLAYENNELCLHEICWLLSRFVSSEDFAVMEECQ